MKATIKKKLAYLKGLDEQLIKSNTSSATTYIKAIAYFIIALKITTKPTLNHERDLLYSSILNIDYPERPL